LLIEFQKRPGFPMPDSISRQIMRTPADELHLGD
jgi:hypothetical protein